MSKQRKRTVVEEEYMQNHKNDDMKQIAEDLGRSYEFVRKYIATLPEEPVEPPSAAYTRTIEEKTNILTKTGAGKKGVAIMTQAASQKITSNRNKKKKLGPDNSVRKIHEDQ
jgi:hypothetical protein